MASIPAVTTPAASPWQRPTSPCRCRGGELGGSVKKPKTYEALRDKGMSKERAARFSNAQANKEKKG